MCNMYQAVHHIPAKTLKINLKNTKVPPHLYYIHTGQTTDRSIKFEFNSTRVIIVFQSDITV